MRILTALLLLGTAGSAAAQARPEVAITYLGNMGVVLEAGSRRVVIDGFHHGELRDYAAVPSDLLAPLEGATGQFRRIDVAMTTHRHLDHFAASSIGARLRADPAVHYLAPLEVIDTLRSRGIRVDERVHPLAPPVNSRVELDLGGIRVAAIDLPHNRTRTPQARNLGYLVRLGGVTVLHVGDADPATTTYQRHGLPAEAIDVAILPYWYLVESSEMVREHIAPRTVVATHVGPSDSARVRAQVTRAWPGAVVLTRPGESIRVRR